ADLAQTKSIDAPAGPNFVYQQALANAGVNRAHDRAAAEGNYQKSAAHDQTVAAQAVLALHSTDMTYKLAAAKAAAFETWVSSLATPASGQADSPYTLFAAAQA